MPTNVRLPKKEELSNEALTKDRNGRLIKSVTFFGDSAIPEGDPIYESVYSAAKHLAEQGYTIVNGGGPGIMKAATEGAEEIAGDTVAVYWEPKLASFFEGKNLANVTDESDASSNYVMRTFGLIEKGDAYVVCKGGTGTISEFGLVWALSKLYYGCHKPVILYGDFWPPLIEAFQKAMYIDDKEFGVLYYATTPEEVHNILIDHEKRIEACKVDPTGTEESAFVLSPKTSMTARSYNENAQSYQSQYAGRLVAKDQLDEFKSLVHAPAKVMDIGCGPGFDTKYLAEKYAVTSMDISKRMVEIARFENPGVDIKYGDITTFPIEKNTYKGIWSRGAIHHIHEEDLDGVFQKIADALVEDGIFYLIVREGEGEELLRDSKHYGEYERFYHFFTVEELKERGEKAGLSLETVHDTKRSHKWIAAIFRKGQKH